MALEHSTETVKPKWYGQLNLKPGDPAIEKLEAIAKIFDNLKLSVAHLSLEKRRAIHEKDRGKLSGLADEPDFKYGIDYFFGKYQGKPLSVEQNAAAAQYQGRKGVEKWRILKSVAFAAPDKGVIIAHVRGDRVVDTATLASGTDLSAANAETLKALGVEFGTVNPFIPVSDRPIQHVFDSDLVTGKDYPADDMVFTSSGDPRFYVGFDVQRYLRAVAKVEPNRSPLVHQISEKDTDSPERIIARRPITVIGGDSGNDTARFGQMVLSTVIRRLDEKKAFYGDRSAPHIDLKLDPRFASSIDTLLYGSELRAHVKQVADQLQKSTGPEKVPIVTFASMAMHGIGGPILRRTKGIEYIGPQEALTQIRDELAKQDIEITHTMLLGLPSVYEKYDSAFAGEILDKALPVNDNAKREIHDFVQDCKTEHADPERFFRKIVSTVLRQVTKGQTDTLKDKNIGIILGASELESFAGELEHFAGTNDDIQETFAVIKSNDATSITQDLSRVPDSKIRLIFIQPGQAVADMIARKTLGLET